MVFESFKSLSGVCWALSLKGSSERTLATRLLSIEMILLFGIFIHIPVDKNMKWCATVNCRCQHSNLPYKNYWNWPGELLRKTMISSRYLDRWKHHRCYGYIINSAFCSETKTIWYFIGVYIRKRILHSRLEIWNFSSLHFTCLLHSKRNFVSPRGHARVAMQYPLFWMQIFMSILSEFYYDSKKRTTHDSLNIRRYKLIYCRKVFALIDSQCYHCEAGLENFWKRPLTFYESSSLHGKGEGNVKSLAFFFAKLGLIFTNIFCVLPSRN